MRYNSDMITLYQAHTVYEGERAILSALKKTEGRKIVIVPDPFTLALETSILAGKGEEGTFDVEVMSFARLAAVALGDKLGECLSPAGCVMLMEKAVSKSELSVYGKVARTPGFAAEVYAAITAIRNSGYSCEALESVAGDLPEYVRKKTEDIVTLYRGYLGALGEREDSTTRLEALVAAISEGSALSEAHFFVADHFDFNAKQLEVLKALMANAASVSVAVADHGGSENRRVYPSRTFEKLIQAAKESGRTLQVVPVKSDLPADKRLIADTMFSYGKRTGKTKKVYIAEAKDLEEEVTLLATEIVRLVRKEGLRYRDVAVITPDFTGYLPYLERIFSY